MTNNVGKSETAVGDAELQWLATRIIDLRCGEPIGYSAENIEVLERIERGIYAARSALADVGECERCSGIGSTAPFDDVLGRKIGRDQCFICQGTGKQPRPAAEVCPYCGAPEHAPRCCQESPAAEVEVCGECGKRWSCCPHGDKSCVLHHPPSPAAEELYQCLCGAVFRKGKEAREHDCYAATRPAAHTAQLTEDEREALEFAAERLDRYATKIRTGPGGTHIDLIDAAKRVSRRAATLRRLASTAERE